MTREANDRLETDLSALLDGELEPERMLPLLDALLDRPDLQAFYRAGRQLDTLLEETVLPEAADVATGAHGAPRGASRENASGSNRARQQPWRRFGSSPDRPWSWIPVPTWAIGAVAALAVAIVAWNAAPDGATSFRFGPGAAVEPGGRARMNDHRFIEMTSELLRADPRYQRKMLEVMNQVENLRAAPEGSSEGRGPRSEDLLAGETGSRESEQLD